MSEAIPLSPLFSFQGSLGAYEAHLRAQHASHPALTSCADAMQS